MTGQVDLKRIFAQKSDGQTPLYAPFSIFATLKKRAPNRPFLVGPFFRPIRAPELFMVDF